MIGQVEIEMPQSLTIHHNTILTGPGEPPAP